MDTSYICESGCRPARGIRKYNDDNKKKREFFEKYDIGKLKEIDSRPIPYWFPSNPMLNVASDTERWGLLWRPYHGSIRRVDQFFEKRTLWALSLILSFVSSKEDRPIHDTLKFVFTSCLLGLSKMLRESNTAIMEGVLYMPPVYKEISALGSFLNKGRSVASGLIELLGVESTGAIMSCQSACDLSSIRTNSIDFIFTDPPYSNKRQYGELNFIWESWLGLDTKWHEEEIIVNETRGMSEDDWARLMRSSLSECYRVLKPGRWLSLCYTKRIN